MKTIRTQLRQQMRRLETEYQSVCQIYGLKPSDVDILHLLFETSGGISPATVADDLCLSPNFTRARLRALEERRLLSIIEDGTPLIHMTILAEALRPDIYKAVADAEALSLAFYPLVAVKR